MCHLSHTPVASAGSDKRNMSYGDKHSFHVAGNNTNFHGPPSHGIRLILKDMPQIGSGGLTKGKRGRKEILSRADECDSSFINGPSFFFGLHPQRFMFREWLHLQRTSWRIDTRATVISDNSHVSIIIPAKQNSALSSSRDSPFAITFLSALILFFLPEASLAHFSHDFLSVPRSHWVRLYSSTMHFPRPLTPVRTDRMKLVRPNS